MYLHFYLIFNSFYYRAQESLLHFFLFIYLFISTNPIANSTCMSNWRCMYLCTWVYLYLYTLCIYQVHIHLRYVAYLWTQRFNFTIDYAINLINAEEAPPPLANSNLSFYVHPNTNFSTLIKQNPHRMNNINMNSPLTTWDHAAQGISSPQPSGRPLQPLSHGRCPTSPDYTRRTHGPRVQMTKT